MSEQETAAVNKFDAYVKRTFRNAINHHYNDLSKSRKRKVNFSDLSKSEEDQLIEVDTYPFEIFNEALTTKLFDAVIHDELLYEALLSLSPDRREIVLLKYWGKMSDAEVGEILSMSRQMVGYNRNKSLELLKIFIEEMRRNDERFKL